MRTIKSSQAKLLARSLQSSGIKKLRESVKCADKLTREWLDGPFSSAQSNSQIYQERRGLARGVLEVDTLDGVMKKILAECCGGRRQ